MSILSLAGCGMRDAGCGMRDAGCGMRDARKMVAVSGIVFFLVEFHGM